ncbi:armadillo-type protein [Tribonema minus]|uniref:Armadillo-type protein n=1 Tax=Tribonema minus TaxID=303371 RepID=A0A835ZQ81_9STRA|nr:armadillo-type protein [Tribonema minus]
MNIKRSASPHAADGTGDDAAKPLPSLLYYHKPSLATAVPSEEISGTVPVQLSWGGGWLLGLPLNQTTNDEDASGGTFNAGVAYTAISWPEPHAADALELRWLQALFACILALNYAALALNAACGEWIAAPARVEPPPLTGVPGPFTKPPADGAGATAAHTAAAALVGALGLAAVLSRQPLLLSLYVHAAALGVVLGAPRAPSAFLAARYAFDAALVSVARAVRRRVTIQWETEQLIVMATKEQIAAHVAELRSNPAALEPIMLRCFVNDTEQIKAAEEILKQYTKKPQCVPALMSTMQISPHEQVRQLAAVLLKKKIAAHWAKFTPEEQAQTATTTKSHARSRTYRRASPNVCANGASPMAVGQVKNALLAAVGREPQRRHRVKNAPLAAAGQEPQRLVRHAVATLMASLTPVKNALLAAVGQEPQRLVRHAVATLMASLAKQLFADSGGGWPEMLQFIATCAGQGGSEEHRELAFVMLQELTETVGDVLKAHFASLKALFLQALVDPSLRIQALVDPSPRVQVAALQSSSSLLAYLSMEQEALVFADLIPPTLAVAQQCVARADETSVCHVMDVLADLCNSPLPIITPYLTQVGGVVDLCNSPLPIITPYLTQVIDFILCVLRNDSLEMTTRDSASLVLGTLAEFKPKALGKTGCVPAVLKVMLIDFTIMSRALLPRAVELIAGHTGSAANALFTYEALAGAEEDSDEDYDGPNTQSIAQDSDEDYDGANTQSIAQAALDQLALYLPGRFIFPPAMELCGQCFDSPDPHTRKAGVAVMGVITEGCNELIRMNLDQILPKILHAAVDPEPAVRECACFCLGQLSEHCQPDILEYHAEILPVMCMLLDDATDNEILPVVFMLLDDATDNVKGVSCYVLEMFCENLQPDTVLPFLEPLMQRLVQMLQTPKRAVQEMSEMSVAAIAATAIAAEKAFTRYLDGTMLLITDDTMMALRGRALECMGHIAIAVEAEAFQPYVNMCMQSASEGLKIDNVELHEFAYTFFANLSKVLKDQMAPFMPELVPHLLAEVTAVTAVTAAWVTVVTAVTAAWINESDGGEGLQALAGNVEEVDAAAIDADDDDDSDASGSSIDAEAYSKMLGVHTAELDKKKAALLALGGLAEFAPAPFEPHLQAVMECLRANTESWHSEIRSEVCNCLKSVAGVSVAVHPPAEEEWVAGQTIPLHPHTTQLTSAVVMLLLKVMKEDVDSAVVAHACAALGGVLAQIGPMALTPHLNETMQLVAQFLTGKAPCQETDVEDDDDSGPRPTGSGDEEEEEDDDANGSDGDLDEAVSDLIGELARVIGPPFSSFFDTFLPMLLKRTRGSNPASERQTYMGAIAEVMQVLGPVGPRYVPSVMPAVRKGLKDSDSRVVRNTCFCAGVLAEGAGESITPHVLELLQLLAPIFQKAGKGSTEGGLLDNAAAAVARIVMAAPGAVPMEQVLPALLSALPLKVDAQENETVYGCVIGLLKMRHPAALASLPAIMTVLAKALAEGSIADDAVKAKITAGLKDPQLVSEMGPQMAAAIEQGEAFIDRHGPSFEYVLGFLRNRRLVVPSNFSDYQWDTLQLEEEFYCVAGLLDAIKEARSPAAPLLQAGQPLLLCARALYIHQGAVAEQVNAGVAVVPSARAGQFSYAITYQQDSTGPQGWAEGGMLVDAREKVAADADPARIIHAHLRHDCEEQRQTGECLARLTPALLRQFHWRPLVLPPGATAAEALAHVLSLWLSASDDAFKPRDYEYSWGVGGVANCCLPPQSDGRLLDLDAGGATSGADVLQQLGFGDVQAQVVGRHWRRAAESFVSRGVA